jgi:hypothetical protein
MAKPYSEMKRSGIELGNAQIPERKTIQKNRGRMLASGTDRFFFLYMAKPYSEMKQSGIELKHCSDLNSPKSVIFLNE